MGMAATVTRVTTVTVNDVLERHVDPFHYAPAVRDEGLVFWKDLARRMDAIAERNPKDARALSKVRP
jgi:hypothetical protein